MLISASAEALLNCTGSLQPDLHFVTVCHGNAGDEDRSLADPHAPGSLRIEASPLPPCGGSPGRGTVKCNQGNVVSTTRSDNGDASLQPQKQKAAQVADGRLFCE